MKLKDFDFVLPNELIATHPASPRDSSKLLVIGETLQTKKFSDLPSLLGANDLLVFNNSKVIPARLFAKKDTQKFEFLLHRKLIDNKWLAFAKPGKKLKVGDCLEIIYNQDPQQSWGSSLNNDLGKITSKARMAVTGKLMSGEVEIEFEDESVIAKHGQMPLPPYIKRQAESADLSNYQTVYAKHEGSVAAPTAGLHFTDELLTKFPNKAFVTLHVGAGTFQPVKVENIAEHKMHSEYYEIPLETSTAIKKAKQQGGKIIAVGTTSLRVLESSSGLASAGETQIFITLGYKFKIVDALVTNFHLPKSTLFMLTAALAGLGNMQQAYQYAITNNFRFYSYGDACFIKNLDR